MLRNEFIKCPKTPAEWHEKAQEFASLWQYPRAAAAIDGKHIEIEVNFMKNFYECVSNLKWEKLILCRPHRTLVPLSSILSNITASSYSPLLMLDTR